MKRFISALAVLFILTGCNSSDDSQAASNDYDRAAMLTNWADNIIVPAFDEYKLRVDALSTAVATFNASPDAATLQSLRTSWVDAYIAYQKVSIFYIGKGEDLAFKDASNTYPTDVAGINANIASGSYNLSLSSEFRHAGFPALDYLLNGSGSNDAEILAFFSTESAASARRQYLTDVVAKLKFSADAIAADWNGAYRSVFVNSSAAGVTGSVSRLTNAFIKTFERDIRTAKVGIPAGVLSAGTVYPEKVEGLYKNGLSRTLFNAAVQASLDFFDGKHFSDAGSGPGLRSYLDYVNASRDGQPLSSIIGAQLQAILNASAGVNADFSAQIMTDNSRMTALYNALQQALIYLKLDMMQALGITVDYVDNDGD